MNAGPPESSPEDRDALAGEAALHWARTVGDGARIVERSRTERRRRRRIRQLCAAAVVALLLGAVGGRQWLSAPAQVIPPAGSATPSSIVVSAPARQELPDGSSVELKEGARISVQFGPDFRRVRLEQGEAHFTVAKNPQRPFVVTAGGVAVRAVGTEFSVDLGERSVGVLVTEGRVAVERQAPEPIAMLDAGQATAVELGSAAAPAVLPAPLEEQRSRLAWRVPRLELSSTPLAEVVECFNRYGAVRLELADPALGALQLSGVLRVDSPHALLHVLKNDFGLHEERRADATIVLRRP